MSLICIRSLHEIIDKPSYTIGDAGSQWRMTKLKRVMETAAEEGVPPEVIGLERYGVTIQDGKGMPMFNPMVASINPFSFLLLIKSSQ